MRNGENSGGGEWLIGEPAVLILRSSDVIRKDAAVRVDFDLPSNGAIVSDLEEPI
jgi:hypothetical protein